jgi:hypothetical protein
VEESRAQARATKANTSASLDAAANDQERGRHPKSPANKAGGRRQKLIDRLGQKRPTVMMTVTSLLIGIVGTGATLWSSSPGPAVNPPGPAVSAGPPSSNVSAKYNSSSSAKSLAAGSLSITESHGSYQFIVPILNSQPNDQQLQEVSLHVGWGEPIDTCDAPIYLYKVGENLLVKKGSRKVVGSVVLESGVAVGSAVQASGNLSESCGGGRLSLAFRPPALILKGKMTTIISIDLPEEISAASLSAGSSGNAAEPPIHPVRIPNIIVQSNKTIQFPYMEAIVTVQTNSGARMSACEVLEMFTSPHMPNCSSSS